MSGTIMSDIVERLRARYDWNKRCNALCHESADEIERLRGEALAWEAQSQKNRDEIERLQRALQEIATIEWAVGPQVFVQIAKQALAK